MYTVTAPGGHFYRLNPNDSSLNHSNFLFRRHTHTISEDMKPIPSLACEYFGWELATLSHTSHCWNLRNNSVTSLPLTKYSVDYPRLHKLPAGGPVAVASASNGYSTVRQLR